MSQAISESSDRGTAMALARWFLLTGNRLVVSLLVLVGIGALFVAAGLSGLATVTRPTRVMWYLNGTVNGLLTLVPIAVGVNQIVLTHELGSIQDLYQRRTDVTEFRERIGREIGTTMSSPSASTFFRRLLASVSDTARTLESEHGREQEDLAPAVRSIREQADRTTDALESGDPGLFRTLVVVFDYDDSRDFDEVRRLQAELPDDSDAAETLRQLEERFIEIDAARQFLKTVVVERQLAQLSRLLVYTGIPAVAVAVLGIFTYRDVAGLTVSHGLLVVLAGALIAATLVPLAILGAYVLRVATIARRTAAFGPFVPGSDR